MDEQVIEIVEELINYINKNIDNLIKSKTEKTGMIDLIKLNGKIKSYIKVLNFLESRKFLLSETTKFQ